MFGDDLGPPISSKSVEQTARDENRDSAACDHLAPSLSALIANEARCARNRAHNAAWQAAEKRNAELAAVVASNRARGRAFAARSRAKRLESETVSAASLSDLSTTIRTAMAKATAGDAPASSVPSSVFLAVATGPALG